MNVTEGGYGTKLEYSIDGGTTWVELAGVRSWGDILGKTYAEYETTSTFQATRMQEFVGEVYDPGTLNVVLGMDQAKLDVLDGFGVAVKDWQVTFASGSKRKFQGWVKEWKVAGTDAKGEHKVNLSVRVTSAITLVAP